MKKLTKWRFLLNNAALTKVTPEKELHLVCGAGGTRAILGCTGAIFGLYAQGYQTWATIGGISGGAMPALLCAAEISPRQILRKSILTDFAALLLKKRHMFTVLRKFLRQKKAERMPRTAIHCSKGLIKFLNELVPVWPDKFWTMAIADVPGKGRCQVLFTKAGVFVYKKDGSFEQIAFQPPPVGEAVAASCAIPGVIDHVEMHGMYLYDGMLSWDGRTPAAIVQKHFGAAYEDIVAVDVGGIQNAFPALQKHLLAYWCSTDCHPDTHMRADDWEKLGVKVVRANVTNFTSLKLSPTRKQRSAALRIGFRAAVRSFGAKKKIRINPTASAALREFKDQE